MQATTTFGALLRDTPAGAEVAEVTPGELAAEVGLEPGDLVLQLDTAPVFGNREVACFTRRREVGDEVDVVWAHGDEIRKGRGRLTPRDELVFAHRA